MAKSSKIANGIGFLLGMGLFIGSGYLMWIVITRLRLFLESANPSISAAIVGAMATVLVGIGGALYTQAQTKKREIEEAHRSTKVEIYKRYLDMISRVMADQNPNVSLKGPSEQELINFLVELKTDMILWGSPKIINAQLSFEKASRDGENVLFAADDLYKAIREDIGLSNRGLGNRQLMKMYLKNPDELDAPIVSNKAS